MFVVIGFHFKQTAILSFTKLEKKNLIAASGFIVDQLANLHSDTLRDLAPLS